MSRHLAHQRVDTELAGRGMHFGAAGDGHDVSRPARSDHRQQGRVAAVDLVAGDPAGRVTAGPEPLEHRGGELRLGGETHLVGVQARPAAPFRIVGPCSGQVQLTSVENTRADQL